MGDFNSEMMQKKLRMASNAEGYSDILDEQNVLRQENFLTQENFRRFEQGGWDKKNKEDKKRSAQFRSQLKEAMMWDRESARAFKDEEAYKDIFEEAKKEKKQLKIDANRTGASKVFHDITGSKKKKAQDKLERMAKLKERLPEKNAINDLFDEKKADMEALIRENENEVQETVNKAKSLLEEHEPERKSDNITLYEAKEICLKYLSAEIKDDMSAEEKEHAAAHNELLFEKYNDIYQKNTSIKQTYENNGKGAFIQREVLRLCSRKRLDDNNIAARFAHKYPETNIKGVGGAPTSDIVRDLGRWVKDIDDEREVDFSEMKNAFDHAVNINNVTILGCKKEIDVYSTVEKEVEEDGKIVKKKESVKTGTEMVDTVDSETYKASVAFCKSKLELYQNKAVGFLRDHPELAVPYPKYEDLIKNCERLHELYKIGQSLNNLGKHLCYSMYRYNKTNPNPETRLDPEEMAKIKIIAAEVGAANSLCMKLVAAGLKWDKASTDAGAVPTLEDMKNFTGGNGVFAEIPTFESLKAEAISFINTNEEAMAQKNESAVKAMREKKA